MRKNRLLFTTENELEFSFYGLMQQKLLSGETPEIFRGSWSIHRVHPGVEGSIKAVVHAEQQDFAWFEHPTLPVCGVLFFADNFGYTLGGAKEHVDAVVAELKRAFPEREFTPPEDTSVYMHFWSGPTGVRTARTRTRTIAAPSWSEIDTNYAAATAQGLTKLMATQPANVSGGKLILWQGLPGTGKTTAIRALARSWRKWCSVEYVLDPEVLFGGGADYLTSVMLKGSDNDDAPVSIYDVSNADKWRLLVLEDAGELISQDAKSRTGQGLSKLLNMADGLIGQGIRLMILITTNEELEKLNAAVSRPGRCLQQLVFAPLSPAEAAEWRNKHYATPERISQPLTIADLYAGRTTPSGKTDTKAGF